MLFCQWPCQREEREGQLRKYPTFPYLSRLSSHACEEKKKRGPHNILVFLPSLCCAKRKKMLLSSASLSSLFLLKQTDHKWFSPDMPLHLILITWTFFKWVVENIVACWLGFKFLVSNLFHVICRYWKQFAWQYSWNIWSTVSCLFIICKFGILHSQLTVPDRLLYPWQGCHPHFYSNLWGALH